MIKNLMLLFIILALNLSNVLTVWSQSLGNRPHEHELPSRNLIPGVTDIGSEEFSRKLRDLPRNHNPFGVPQRSDDSIVLPSDPMEQPSPASPSPSPDSPRTLQLNRPFKAVVGTPYIEKIDYEQKQAGMPAEQRVNTKTNRTITSNCDPWARPLRSIDAVFPNFPNDREETDPIQQSLELIEGYDKTCLKSAESLPPRLREQITEMLGILTLDDQPICTATRIAPAAILTARHCLTVPEAHQKFDLRTIRTRMKLVLLAYPDTAYSLDEEVPNRHYQSEEANTAFETNDLFDFVVLTVKALDRPFRPVSFGKPQQFDELIIFGLHRFVFQREYYVRKFRGERLQSIDWITTARWDSQPSCQIRAITRDRCLHYGCQSEGGMSGAPIFRRTSSGEAEIIGIHIRGANQAAVCQDPNVLVGNVGVWPDQLPQMKTALRKN